MPAGYHLPSDTYSPSSRVFRGYATPTSDRRPQICAVPPDRCIPVVFLPGIMGSNLRITDEERIKRLKRDPDAAESNLAWRPDFKGSALGTAGLSARDRQLLLDPTTTAVDLYDPASTTPERDGDGRHANVRLPDGFFSTRLCDDPPRDDGLPRRTAVQKARERGWGEVYFGSYGHLLCAIEQRLYQPLAGGKVSEQLQPVVGVDPKRWGLDPATPQEAMTEEELKAAVRETFFPAHAIGYNWLADNRDSAKEVAKRVKAVVASYTDRGFACPGVILVTHSMGGLLGRAIVHPGIGGLQDLVLGVVHGVQPALGAAAAYRRMHAGFEDPGLFHAPMSSLAAKVAGNHGDEVTAVLANAPGGLQLLPSKAYGDGWLRIQQGDRELARLPERGDPYEEIYKLRGKWYGLFPNEDWLNPAGLAPQRKYKSFLEQTHAYLDKASQFHADMDGQYHARTYAHYGIDPKQQAFGNVTWKLESTGDDTQDWKRWTTVVDNDRQGVVTLSEPVTPSAIDAPPETALVTASLQPADENGDGTVPIRSSDDQLRRGGCKAVFRQTGYDHQGSYQRAEVVDATLYCILRIAQRVQLP